SRNDRKSCTGRGEGCPAMTRYTVVWDTDLQTVFTRTWTAGDSNMRSTLTAIADWVDTYLAKDPSLKGQAVPDQSARMIAVPFSVATVRVDVTFQVLPNDRPVRVKRFTFRST